MDSLFTFHFTFFTSLTIRGRERGRLRTLYDPLFKRVTLLVIKEIPIKCSTCKTSAGFLKKFPIKCSTCKTSAGFIKIPYKTHLQFYMRNPFKKFSDKKKIPHNYFFLGKSLVNFFSKHMEFPLCFFFF